MKRLLSFLILFFFAFGLCQEKNIIKIIYDFKDHNPELIRLEKEPDVLVVNFQNYILEGNNNYSEFYVVNDLSFENKVNFLIEQKSPVKRRKFSYFYNGKFNVDILNKKSYAELELGNQKYLVTDSISHINWNINRSEKEILNFKVRQATFTDDDKNVEAWYAPSLPFKIGPLNYFHLPGVILELTIKMKGENKPIYHLLANEILLDIEKDLQLPKNAKIVTQRDFDSIYQKHQERLIEIRSEGVNLSD